MVTFSVIFCTAVFRRLFYIMSLSLFDLKSMRGKNGGMPGTPVIILWQPPPRSKSNVYLGSGCYYKNFIEHEDAHCYTKTPFPILQI